MELETLEPNFRLIGVLNYLKLDIDGYPYESEKDEKYFWKLLMEFSTLDIEEELKQYHA